MDAITASCLHLTPFYTKKLLPMPNITQQRVSSLVHSPLSCATIAKFSCGSREYVVEHVLREAHKICIAMSVTFGIAAVQKSAEDTLIGAELVQKML